MDMHLNKNERDGVMKKRIVLIMFSAILLGLIICDGIMYRPKVVAASTEDAIDDPISSWNSNHTIFTTYRGVAITQDEYDYLAERFDVMTFSSFTQSMIDVNLGKTEYTGTGPMYIMGGTE